MTFRLVVLYDRERLLRASPGGRRLTELADTRFLDVPLAEVPDAELVGVHGVVTIRERTRLHAATLGRLPDRQVVMRTGGHAYHVDLAETARRGIPVTLWWTSAASEAAMRELTFGLAIATLRRLPEATRAFDDGGWPPLLGAPWPDDGSACWAWAGKVVPSPSWAGRSAWTSSPGPGRAAHPRPMTSPGWTWTSS